MSQILYAIIVVLSYPRTVAGFIAFVQTVIQKMTNNANFPNATSLLASASSALTAYKGAVSSSETTKGLKGQRSETRKALFGVLYQLRDLVRTAAESNPGNAQTIVESAGMTLAKRVARIKPLIEVIQAAISGSVVCRAKAPGIPASYFWHSDTFSGCIGWPKARRSPGKDSRSANRLGAGPA
jgi:hypothetical protein